MKQDGIEEGRFTENAHGLGTVTEGMVRRRAREIALVNGRSESQALDSDLEEARRELTGEERVVPMSPATEELTEAARWNPVPGSSGTKAPVLAAPDEQMFAEELVEEGVEDAELDQSVQATRESLKREKRP
jgi:hypothetical protein